MEPASAIELISMEVDQINSMTEFWLACVFAVIAASHLARDSLNVYLRVTVVSLFSLVTGISIVSLLGDLQQINWLMRFVSGDPPVGYARLAMSLRFALYAIGSVATIGYVFYVGRTSGVESA